MNDEKTKALVCGPRMAVYYERKGLQMPTFTFLGFLHVWGKALNRKRGVWFWRVKRRTCPKRFKKKLAEIKVYIRENRHEKNLIIRIKQIFQGYLNYFAVNDNQRRIAQFVQEVTRILFKYLNKRGQKRSMDWDRFVRVLEKIKFPDNKPRLKNLFFDSRAFGSKPKMCQ